MGCFHWKIAAGTTDRLSSQQGRFVTWSLAAAVALLGLLASGSANGFNDGVDATIFDNFDQVLGCSPSPCHQPIVAATVLFLDAPSIVEHGDVVDLTLRMSGGPGVTCGFTADTLGGEFSVVQPDPRVRYFGVSSSPSRVAPVSGLTHSTPRSFDASVCEFILRWEAAVLGTSRIAVNGVVANGDFMRGGDAGGFADLVIEVAPRVYDIAQYDIGQGFSIDSGRIGTVDTAADDGFLSVAEIDSFSVSYTSPAGQGTLTDSDSTASISGNVALSATQIAIPDESPADHFNQLRIDDDTSIARVIWLATAGTEPEGGEPFDEELVDVQDSTEDQQELFLPSGAVEVARVPEPSPLVLRWSSLLSLLLLARAPTRIVGRRRRHRLRHSRSC